MQLPLGITWQPHLRRGADAQVPPASDPPAVPEGIVRLKGELGATPLAQALPAFHSSIEAQGGDCIAEFPVEADLLDKRILSILIVKAAKAKGNGYRWFGLSVGQTLRALGMRPTSENVCMVKRAYTALERYGRAYPLHGARRVKWFPSTRAVEHHAFKQQGKLEGFL